MKALKIGLLMLGALVVVTLLTLRVTGLEPPYVDPNSQEFAKSGRTTRPGLWLTGEVVHDPVTNWDWVNKVTIRSARTRSCSRLEPGTASPIQ